mmetsp:Transcript_22565/g.42525  ORF Transcript_22565/g.42525 Transcript_22565/m.42525 type:complete len:213 (+) Transcript_22565:499-1137(+)
MLCSRMMKRRASAAGRHAKPTLATFGRGSLWTSRKSTSRTSVMQPAVLQRAPVSPAQPASRHVQRTSMRMLEVWSVVSRSAAPTPAPKVGWPTSCGQTRSATRMRSAARGLASSTNAAAAGLPTRPPRETSESTMRPAVPRPASSSRTSALATTRPTLRRMTQSGSLRRSAAQRPALCTRAGREPSFRTARASSAALMTSAAKTPAVQHFGR